MVWKRIILSVGLLLTITGVSAACSAAPNSTLAPTPSSILAPTPSSTLAPTPSSTLIPTPTVTYSQYQLEYLLLSNFPDAFWCDPDFYPVAREGQEQTNAQQQFSTIRANAAEFSAILEHLGLTAKTDYSDEEKLSIYREHKKLNSAMTIAPSGAFYNFSLRTGRNQGQHIEGTIDTAGRLKIQKQETSFNTCPICLSKGTLIDTPGGPAPVEQLQTGMMVWTVDESGKRVAAAVIKTSSTPVPPSFEMVKLNLNDGRTVTASPGHPSADMRALGDYHSGDVLDGGRVIAVEYIIYQGGATYDLLPSRGPGLYWANGILLRSTINSWRE